MISNWKEDCVPQQVKCTSKYLQFLLKCEVTRYVDAASWDIWLAHVHTQANPKNLQTSNVLPVDYAVTEGPDDCEFDDDDYCGYRDHSFGLIKWTRSVNRVGTYVRSAQLHTSCFHKLQHQRECSALFYNNFLSNLCNMIVTIIWFGAKRRHTV